MGRPHRQKWAEEEEHVRVISEAAVAFTRRAESMLQRPANSQPLVTAGNALEFNDSAEQKP